MAPTFYTWEEARSDWVNALGVQLVAGDIRDMWTYGTYQAYQEAQKQGQVSSDLSLGDDFRWYYYFGE